MPVQWLFLKLGSRAARTFPNRYHRLVAALFGIHIRVVGQAGHRRRRADGGQSHQLGRHRHLLRGGAAFLCLQGGSGRLAASSAPWRGCSAPSLSNAPAAARRAETRDEIRERLLAGDTLLLFPEGTSHDGNRVLPFKSALLGAAEAVLANGQHVKVQPVSAAFTGLYGLPMGRENRPLFAWYGDMEMVPHLWEALKAGPLDVVVQFHPPFSLDAMDRKTLAKKAQEVVQAGRGAGPGGARLALNSMALGPINRLL